MRRQWHRRIFAGVTVSLLAGVLIVYSVRLKRSTDPLAGMGFEIPDEFKLKEWWQASSLLKWDWERPPEYRCSPVQWAGKWAICMDEAFKLKKPCLVYSFGITEDKRFEEATSKLGCEVHSFNPSVVSKVNSKTKVHYHDFIIAGEDDNQFKPKWNAHRKESWKVKRLKTILTTLGHEKSVIDILKLDVDLLEWDAVRDMLDSQLVSKIRQFLVRWNLLKDRLTMTEVQHHQDTYLQFVHSGMSKFINATDVNHPHGVIEWEVDVNQVQVSYINKNFLHT